MRIGVAGREGRIHDVVSRMLALVSKLSTLCKFCRENGHSKSTETNMDHEIVKH
jgi:hypothetical protein